MYPKLCSIYLKGHYRPSKLPKSNVHMGLGLNMILKLMETCIMYNRNPNVGTRFIIILEPYKL